MAGYRNHRALRVKQYLAEADWQAVFYTVQALLEKGQIPQAEQCLNDYLQQELTDPYRQQAQARLAKLQPDEEDYHWQQLQQRLEVLLAQVDFDAAQAALADYLEAPSTAQRYQELGEQRVLALLQQQAAWDAQETQARQEALDAGKPLRILKNDRGSVPSVAFAPDGQTLVSGSDDKTIKLWSIE